MKRLIKIPIVKLKNKIKQYPRLKNKIVYVGITATSLYDTKSVPVSKIYPGVEIHATYVNNLIDNNFIKKAKLSVNILISLALALLVGFVVIKSSRIPRERFAFILATVSFSMSYVPFSEGDADTATSPSGLIPRTTALLFFRSKIAFREIFPYDPFLS